MNNRIPKIAGCAVAGSGPSKHVYLNPRYALCRAALVAALLLLRFARRVTPPTRPYQPM